MKTQMKTHKQRLEKLYSELHTLTTMYGLHHHGNEVHKKLEETLATIRGHWGVEREKETYYLKNWDAFVRVNYNGEVEIAQAKNEKEYYDTWGLADYPEPEFLEDLKALGWEVEWKGHGHTTMVKR